jgi:hypothetical protein
MTETDINLGMTGAKRQTWNEANPRALLEVLIAEHPGASRTRLLKLFRARLKEDDGEDYVDVIVEYWFTNNIRSMTSSLTDEERKEKAAARKRKVDALAAELKKRIEVKAQIVLLDMVMPSGKPLRDSTGAECKLAGGWLARLASRMQPDELVGENATEEDLQNLYSATVKTKKKSSDPQRNADD